MVTRFLFFFIVLFIFSCQNEQKTTLSTDNQPVDTIDTPYKKELDTIFNSLLVNRIIDFQQQFKNRSSTISIAELYQIGAALRDTLMLPLNDYTKMQIEEGLPDLFWLQEVLPAYVPQVVAEGTAYYLFNDFRQWKAISSKTDDLLDDAFVDLNIQLYPQDSIEYFYPAYFLQTWDYGGSSLLGRDIHLNLLHAMEKHWADTTQQQFRKEVMVEKNRLLHDILESTDGGYWENQKNILRELDKIISIDFKILTKNDKIALRQRRQQFQNPKKNNILINAIDG